MKMKRHNILTLLTATAIAAAVAAQTSVAQTNTSLFPARIQLTCVGTNGSGLVYDHVGTSDFIQECAAENGVTNLTGLSLVYNRSNSSLEVVSGTNQTIVCTPLTFSGGSSFTNTNNSVVERLAFVFVETNTVSSGVLAATERFNTGTSNRPPSFSLIGRLSYTEPAAGTNSAEICRGVLLVGNLLNHGEGDDHDNDNNGHHGEGNNGNGGGNGGSNGNGHGH
jgi:hypothetical protein